jgi:hypothetical protein
MNYKPKNLFNKGSAMILITLLTCLTLTFCSRDMDDASIMEVESIVDAKSLYFYGSDADFEKFEGVDMTRITSEEELNAITKTAGNSYALFVGKDIDVRSGIVDDLRNSGVLVAQLNEEVIEPKKLSAQAQLLKEVTPSNDDKTRTLDIEKNLVDDELSFTTYLSVNGRHKTLISMSENIEQAVTSILEWSEKKTVEESEEMIPSKSGNKTLVFTLDVDFIWSGVADFNISTFANKADTEGYLINDGSGNKEYPSMFIFDHKITMASQSGSYRANDLQIVQQPYGEIDSEWHESSLREYFPVNGDNGVLNGRTGSDSYGYGINSGGGFSLAGPDFNVGTSFDWSHSTDWSIPACQVKVYHSLADEIFHAQYDIDPMGSWAYQTITAESYTYYATRGLFRENRYFLPTTYALGLYNPSQGSNGYKTLLVELSADSEIKIAQINGAYLNRQYISLIDISSYSSGKTW